ncbi:hypothetical protein DL763_008460 [Monosporascus cannonballus]|nr:hypothetical protein DL763_008460 [Monosporascus cannonballus]
MASVQHVLYDVPRRFTYKPVNRLKPEDGGELALGWALFPLLGGFERPELQSAPDPFENASGEGAATLERLELGALDEPLMPGGVSDERVYDDENDGSFWGGTDAGPVVQQYAACPRRPNVAPMTTEATTTSYPPMRHGRQAQGQGAASGAGWRDPPRVRAKPVPDPRKLYMYGMFVDGQVPEGLAAPWRGPGVEWKTDVGSWHRFGEYEGMTEWTKEWSKEDED